MDGSSREDRTAVLPNRVAAKLREQGLARVDGLIRPSAAAALLAHVTDRLEQALAHGGSLPSDGAGRSTGGPSPADPVRRSTSGAALGRPGGCASGCEASLGGGERVLGRLLCQPQRHDLKLDLRVPAVRTVLDQLIGALGPSLVQNLGPGAQLFELGALIADPGAARQPAHPDTPFSSRPSVVTVMVALQHVTGLGMGPTGFLPRTHAEEHAHMAYNYGQPPMHTSEAVALATHGDESDAAGAPRREKAASAPCAAGAGLADHAGDVQSAAAACGGVERRKVKSTDSIPSEGQCVRTGEAVAVDSAGADGERGAVGAGLGACAWEQLLRASALRVPLLRSGDALLFDSRVLHFGTAHTGCAPRRVCFYVSLRRAVAENGRWSGCGFSQPGTLLDALRGRWQLSRDGGHLEEVRHRRWLPRPLGVSWW